MVMNYLVNVLKMKLEINFYDRYYQMINSSDFPYELKDQIKEAINPIIKKYFDDHSST